MTIFKGNAVAIVTPFNEKNEVNYDKLSELIKWQIKEGTSAIVVNGTTGESSTLSKDEKSKILKTALIAAGGFIPIIAGTGTNCTEETLEETLMAQELGAKAAMIVTPYYNKTSQKGLINHYSYIANNSNIPIILYNVPGRTGLNIGVQTVIELSKHERIVALKDATGNMSYTMELMSKISEDFSIYSGNDDLNIPIIAAGGIGSISVIGNAYPKELALINEYALNGNFKGALEINNKLYPVIEAVFNDVNPIGIKEAMNIKSLNVGSLRPPLVNMGPNELDNLREKIKFFDSNYAH